MNHKSALDKILQSTQMCRDILDTFLILSIKTRFDDDEVMFQDDATSSEKSLYNLSIVRSVLQSQNVQMSNEMVLCFISSKKGCSTTLLDIKILIIELTAGISLSTRRHEMLASSD